MRWRSTSTFVWMLAIAAVVGWLVAPLHAKDAVPAGPAGKLIEHFHMQRVPEEGPWFSLSYSSAEQIEGAALAARYSGRSHAAGSAIYAVETPADFSAMHRLLTDEVWHFYSGTPIELLLLYPDGHGSKIILGPDVFAGQFPQFTVPQGVWQGSAPTNTAADSYSFVGTQLSPGFDYADFEIGYRDRLRLRYPEFAKEIERLTREEFAHAPSYNDISKPQPSIPSASTFSATDVATVSQMTGIDLQELVGRTSRQAQSTQVSVAQFTLQHGSSFPTSFNRQAQEILLVTKGVGLVQVGTRVVQLRPGSVVFIPPGVHHAVAAAREAALEFVAICSPAFSAEDYVVVQQ